MILTSKVFEVMSLCINATLQSFDSRTLLNTYGLIVAHAVIIRCFIFSGVVGTSWSNVF